MIGQFRYQRRPCDDTVLVCLLWDGQRRAGKLEVPADLRQHIEEGNLPSSDEMFSIDGALAYGLVLSIRSGKKLRLSGDLTVWRAEWGEVIHTH